MNGVNNNFCYGKDTHHQDAILVVDSCRRIVTWNHELIELWGMTTDVLVTLDDKKALKFAADQFSDPIASLAEIERIYAQTELEVHDVISLRGGRYLQRHTYPLRLGKLVVGRVWQFCYRSGVETILS